MSRGSSRPRGRMMGMRRWDGLSRITTDWFGYHNDPELNFSDGDILIFLHESGSSRRGASFRVHAEFLATTGFQSLVDQSVTAPVPTHWAMPARPNAQLSSTVRELYLPAPPGADRDAIARHQLTTRNFFAWLYDRPLTGKTLGASLLDVMDRANIYRPNDTNSNHRDMIAYLDRRGYMDFRECVDHALAALHLAERCQMEALWVNAFSHCVGMNHGLHASIEFDAISRGTKAMITRARLEMDIRLDRVAKSLTTFFDNDVSGSYLGLTQTATDHMDRFRSFLHTYYIESQGFWPPSGFATSFSLRRSVYRSMYVEFRSLYEYLVDSQSTPSGPYSKPAESGMDLLQNIRAFDGRYRLETLPHPLPLLPRSTSSSAPGGFTMKKRRMEREARHVAHMKSLSEASNRESDLTKSPLVRRYHQFEKQTVVDDFNPVNPVEGRKVRWLLIYAIFQILASVISAPKEVVDTEGLSYPLCCQRPRTMPWMKDTVKDSASIASSLGRSVKSNSHVRQRILEQKQELRRNLKFITSKRNWSSTSLITASSTPDSRDTSSAPSSPTPTLISKSSQSHSLLRFLHKRRACSTDTSTSSITAPPARPEVTPFHEVAVHGYGNNRNDTVYGTPMPTIHSPESNRTAPQSSSKTAINNSSFIRTASSPPTDRNRQPSSLLRPPPMSLKSRKSTTPSPLLSPKLAPYSRPESPTLPTTPSSSRDSSRNSAISRTTSNTSTSSDGGELTIDHISTKSSDTTITVTVPAAEKPTPIPNPAPAVPASAPVRTTSKQIPAPRSIFTSNSSKRPRIPTSFLPSKSSPPISTPTNPDRGDSYLTLPSNMGSGRIIDMPPAFLRSYSGGSLSGNGSITNVHVIREEVEAS